MMEEPFVLTVNYNNEEKEYQCTFRKWGYSYRITVNINGMETWFEPDEERNFRAVSMAEGAGQKPPDRDLLAVIAAKLCEVFR